MTERLITDENDVVQGKYKLDDILRLLANSRRREIVVVLDSIDANWNERDRLFGGLSSTDESMDVTQVRIALHHAHLPMLEELGLIEYDKQNETIRCYQCEALLSVLAAIDLR